MGLVRPRDASTPVVLSVTLIVSDVLPAVMTILPFVLPGLVCTTEVAAALTPGTAFNAVSRAAKLFPVAGKVIVVGALAPTVTVIDLPPIAASRAAFGGGPTISTG